MSKKATIGASPKDRSMDIMDKFIKRQERKDRHKELLPARRKAKDVPMDLWPLKDQLEYWENISPSQKFDRKYSSYIDWLDKLKSLTDYPDSTILDMMAGHKDRIKELFNTKTLPKEALQILRKEGIMWV